MASGDDSTSAWKGPLQQHSTGKKSPVFAKNSLFSYTLSCTHKVARKRIYPCVLHRIAPLPRESKEHSVSSQCRDCWTLWLRRSSVVNRVSHKCLVSVTLVSAVHCGLSTIASTEMPMPLTTSIWKRQREERQKRKWMSVLCKRKEGDILDIYYYCWIHSQFRFIFFLGAPGVRVILLAALLGVLTFGVLPSLDSGIFCTDFFSDSTRIFPAFGVSFLSSSEAKVKADPSSRLATVRDNMRLNDELCCWLSLIRDMLTGVDVAKGSSGDKCHDSLSSSFSARPTILSLKMLGLFRAGDGCDDRDLFRPANNGGGIGNGESAVVAAVVVLHFLIYFRVCMHLLQWYISIVKSVWTWKLLKNEQNRQPTCTERGTMILAYAPVTTHPNLARFWNLGQSNNAHGSR